MKIINSIGIILGIVLMITGIVFFNKTFRGGSLYYEGADVSSVTFGGDYYTHSSSSLSKINKSVTELGDVTAGGINGLGIEVQWLCRILGILISSIGLLIVLYCANKLAKDVSLSLIRDKINSLTSGNDNPEELYEEQFEKDEEQEDKKTIQDDIFVEKNHAKELDNNEEGEDEYREDWEPEPIYNNKGELMSNWMDDRPKDDEY